jgi:hypothetical protein
MLIARLTPEQKPRGSANVSFIGAFSSGQKASAGARVGAKKDGWPDVAFSLGGEKTRRALK